jgi:hypothetical protein
MILALSWDGSVLAGCESSRLIPAAIFAHVPIGSSLYEGAGFGGSFLTMVIVIGPRVTVSVSCA